MPNLPTSMRMYKSYVITVFLIVFVTHSFADQTTKGKTPPVDDATLFRTIFQIKHAQLLEATKAVMSLDYERQHQMIKLVFEKMVGVLTQSRSLVESSGYLPGGNFPESPEAKEALSNIIENTALFGELLLRLPDVVYSVMKGNNELQLLLNWCVMFTKDTALLDGNGAKLIHLTAQELNLTERDSNYVNPYKNLGRKQQDHQELLPKLEKKKKKKASKPRGPRMSSSRSSGDL